MTTDSLNNFPPAICLMGPTASGKTDIAVHLVQNMPVEIISVDSVLIYKDMNIGSAKPDAQTLAIAPHRLINFLDPSRAYSVAEFRRDALAAMADITAQGKIPLLVGGTMLYFRALLGGLSELPAADEAVRKKLEAQAVDIGWQAMHEKLQQVDPVAASRIHPNDPQRIQRALEVYEISGEPLSTLQQKNTVKNVLPYNVTRLIVSPADRAVLHQRIEKRFHQMLESGFIDEVKALYNRGDLNLDMPSMRAVGYRQVWEYLDNQRDYNNMVERGVVVTRQLAKRQLTWLRNEKDAIWLDSGQMDLNPVDIKELALKSLNHIPI